MHCAIFHRTFTLSPAENRWQHGTRTASSHSAHSRPRRSVRRYNQTLCASRDYNKFARARVRFRVPRAIECTVHMQAQRLCTRSGGGVARVCKSSETTSVGACVRPPVCVRRSRTLVRTFSLKHLLKMRGAQRGGKLHGRNYLLVSHRNTSAAATKARVCVRE